MRYVLAALSLALVAGLLYGLHTKAVHDSYAAGEKQAAIECIQAIDRSINNANKARTKIEQRNSSLADPAVDSELLAHWMRSDS